MKNLDAFSKRFLIICLGITAVILSLSLFTFSLNAVSPAQAYPVLNTESRPGSNGQKFNGRPMATDSLTGPEDDVTAVQVFGFGIREGVLYFGILYNNNTIGLHKTECVSEDVIHW